MKPDRILLTGSGHPGRRFPAEISECFICGIFAALHPPSICLTSLLICLWLEIHNGVLIVFYKRLTKAPAHFYQHIWWISTIFRKAALSLAFIEKALLASFTTILFYSTTFGGSNQSAKASKMFITPSAEHMPVLTYDYVHSLSTLSNLRYHSWKIVLFLLNDHSLHPLDRASLLIFHPMVSREFINPGKSCSFPLSEPVMGLLRSRIETWLCCQWSYKVKLLLWHI